MNARGIQVIFLALAVTSAADEVCSKNIVCVETQQTDQGVTFTVKNLETYEVTVTLNATLKNMRADVELPLTATYAPKSATTVATITVADPQKIWRWDYRFDWTFGALGVTHDDTVVYELPYAVGKSFKVLQGFRGKFSHTGDDLYAVDWEMPEETPVRAARGGRVVGVRDSFREGAPKDSLRDFANFVMIKHDDGTIGEYDHFRKDGVIVKVGDEVRAGDLIGYSGNVGFTTGPHLHFVVYRALDGKKRQSFPIRFRTATAESEAIKEGRIYTAPSLREEMPAITDKPSKRKTRTPSATASRRLPRDTSSPPKIQIPIVPILLWLTALAGGTWLALKYVRKMRDE